MGELGTVSSKLVRADNGSRILLSQPGGIVISGRRIIGRARYGAEDTA